MREKWKQEEWEPMTGRKTEAEEGKWKRGEDKENGKKRK